MLSVISCFFLYCPICIFFQFFFFFLFDSCPFLILDFMSSGFIVKFVTLLNDAIEYWKEILLIFSFIMLIYLFIFLGVAKFK